MSQVKYQFFISSTYEDLRSERQEVTQAVLELGGFPSGMELFPASDENQWALIRRVIEEADYYIVIVAGRYGSCNNDGISYTEMEYDYAVEKRIPILGFVKDKIEDISAKYSESDPVKMQRLLAFRNKVMSRSCRKYTAPADLGMSVMKSIVHECRVRPRLGWVRADQAISEEDRKREKVLQEELRVAYDEIERLDRELRDRSVAYSGDRRKLLLQEGDEISFGVKYNDADKKFVAERVSMPLDEVFKVIGVSLYGYIKRKASFFNSPAVYEFHNDIAEKIREKIVERVQQRKIELSALDVDACIFQFKELGLLQFSDKQNEDGSVFRGVTLTEYGEIKLTELLVAER